ncbi:alpha/beta hydrolase-fold protein [Ruminococcus sp.]|uniref:alpha/beta hydrolase n=1 Tax=Ruminococcus sp. TaxID=41978 RepID=UPI0025CC90B4|nr:alpha/beta hydrolase-fold protein [Ruminococcus sp.]MBQ8965198.1 esterase family protein [Ruminococcus sp.]
MNSKKLTALITSLILTLTLASCGSSENSGSKESQQTTTTVTEEAPEEEAPAEETEEKTYMEQCEEIMTELPPDEILAERDGVKYPYFTSYTYYSNTAERDTPVNVLLPPDYSDDKEYPVLYILHGYRDNEQWMARDNVHLSTMLNNLVADGEAEEMIVVCPYIFCSKELEYCTGMDEQNSLAYDNFINDMMTDLMPFIEGNFSVKTGRENTAITGFSMGGRESLFIGFSHPEKFGYIGAVCPAPGLISGMGFPPFNLEPEQFCFTENAPELLLISASKADGVVVDNPQKYHDMLTNNGTEHLWHLMENTGHDASSVTPRRSKQK